MNFTPLKDRMLVKIEKRPEAAGGILLPEVSSIRTMGHLDAAQVIAVSPEIEHIRASQRVLLREREGTPLVIEGVKYVLFKLKNIIAVYDSTT